MISLDGFVLGPEMISTIIILIYRFTIWKNMKELADEYNLVRNNLPHPLSIDDLWISISCCDEVN